MQDTRFFPRLPLYGAAVVAALLALSYSASAQTWSQEGAGLSYQDLKIADLSMPDTASAWAIATMDFSNTSDYVPVFFRRNPAVQLWLAGPISPLPPTYTPTSITSLNSTTAWVAAYDADNDNGGKIYKTTDSGTNWVLQASAAFGDAARFVHFFNASDGVAVGDTSVFTTGNGGTSWTRRPGLPVPASAGSRITFGASEVRNGTVWIGSSGQFYKSTNKGLTWTRLAGSIPVALIKAIAFKDSLNGMAIGVNFTSGSSTGGNGTPLDGGGYYRTTNGGATWTFTPYVFSNSPRLASSTEPRFDIAYLPGSANTYVLSSDRPGNGYSAVSTNGGTSWTVIDSTNTFTALAFYDQAHGRSGGVLNTLKIGMYRWNGITPPTPSAVAPAEAATFTLYPNPATDQLFLRHPGTAPTMPYSILNSAGQIVQAGTLAPAGSAPAAIDVSRLASGSYRLLLLQPSSAAGQASFIKR